MHFYFLGRLPDRVGVASDPLVHNKNRRLDRRVRLSSIKVSYQYHLSLLNHTGHPMDSLAIRFIIVGPSQCPLRYWWWLGERSWSVVRPCWYQYTSDNTSWPRTPAPWLNSPSLASYLLDLDGSWMDGRSVWSGLICVIYINSKTTSQIGVVETIHSIK